jgi:hypothetical protein
MFLEEDCGKKRFRKAGPLQAHSRLREKPPLERKGFRHGFFFRSSFVFLTSSNNLLSLRSVPGFLMDEKDFLSGKTGFRREPAQLRWFLV